MSYTKYPFEVKPLLYTYDALEPYISRETLHYHHDKHYATYVDNLNKLLKNREDLQPLEIEDVIMKVADRIGDTDIYNNAGGVYNHYMYFDSLKSINDELEQSIQLISSDIKILQFDMDNKMNNTVLNAIQRDFGSAESMFNKMVTTAMEVFGSGYAWLVANENGVMEIKKYANQNTPLVDKRIPLLNIDVWEHAYYIDYRNVRKDYVDNWIKLINVEQINKRFPF